MLFRLRPPQRRWGVAVSVLPGRRGDLHSAAAVIAPIATGL